MRIAVIGAGNVGGGLGRAAVAAGHDVVVTAAHPEKAQAVAAEIGAQSADSPSPPPRRAHRSSSWPSPPPRPPPSRPTPLLPPRPP